MSREQEYLRRMKALGYEPSLAGMDDEDIEWELNKMDEAERRREAPQPTRTVYRPVDPGLAARILRQMGQPYDPQAISPKQSFYLNGWDDGEDEGPEMKLPDIKPPQRETQPAFDYDPWAKAWRPDWGPEGSPFRTMEYRPGWDAVGPKVQLLSANASGGDQGDSDGGNGSGGNDEGSNGPKITEAASSLWNIPRQVTKDALAGFDLWDEVEKEALARGDSPELARQKGEDAFGRYTVWQATASAATGAAGAGAAKVLSKIPGFTELAKKLGVEISPQKAGTASGAIVGTSADLAEHFNVKKAIKNQVLGNTEKDYNTMFPGNIPPGPG